MCAWCIRLKALVGIVKMVVMIYVLYHVSKVKAWLQ